MGVFCGRTRATGYAGNHSPLLQARDASLVIGSRADDVFVCTRAESRIRAKIVPHVNDLKSLGLFLKGGEKVWGI